MIGSLLVLAFAEATPQPCAGADPAVTSVTSQIYKRPAGIDHYVITATVTNRGTIDQLENISQHVEVLRDGHVLAPQPLPALGAGEAYKVAFAIDRPTAQRSKPLTITIRYVMTAGDRARNECDRSNDEIIEKL